MPSWPIHLVTTFSAEPFGGNPAFVLVADRPLPPSVTAGIREQVKADALAILRFEGAGTLADFVTAAGSHSGPGHSTIAAGHVAFEHAGEGVGAIRLRLPNGAVRDIRREGDLIAADWPVMPAARTDERDLLAPALGVTPIETWRADFGTVAVLADDDAVRFLAPSMTELGKLTADTVIVTARGSGAADFVIRVFAPKLGLPEDPVCGTAHRILTPYWSSRTGRSTLVSHQLSPRGGQLFCRLDGDVVTIAGRAAPFLKGAVEVPY